MSEKVFEFLLKFKPLDYHQGHFVLNAGDPLFLFLSIFIVLFIAFLAIYFYTNIYTTGRSRAMSAGLRILALLLLCIPFLEPMLMLPDTLPKENYLAVMVDNSASMSIPDGYFGGTRHDDAASILYDKKSGILSELEKNYNIRYYTFSGEASRQDSISYQAPDGLDTNLSASLERVVSDFRGLPLSGILLFTDGDDNGPEDIRNIAEETRSLGMPLHVVGLGDESFGREREILEVTTNKELIKGAGAEIDVKAKSWGEEKSPVIFNLYKGDKLVLSKPENLKGAGAVDAFTLYYEPEENDVAKYTLEVAGTPGEVNLENNSLDMLIDSREDSVRILYVEGALRTDFKFIKRALEEDEVVGFTSTTRTGAGKYYRQGITSVNELQGGFPDTEKDLYGFKAIILGDIEANFFSLSQLDMIQWFVSKRGGGFLMLGGMNSFSDGTWWDTPIADLLPVELDQSRKMVIPPEFRNSTRPEDEQGFKFVPTTVGLENPILKFADDAATNKKLWDEMPRLSTINYLGPVKPGATVLAEKPTDEFGKSEPLLITQRYGKGRTAALATASTWRWQMLLDSKDTRQERFWRQFVRWLSIESPGQVNIDLAENRFEPGTEIPVRASVYDSSYNPLSQADVTGMVTDPSGGVSEIQFLPELTEDGYFESTLLVKDPGVYSIDIVAKQDGETIGEQRRSLLSSPSKKEFYDAVLRKSYLQNLTKLNGGVYYEPADAKNIPSNLKVSQTGTTIFHNEYVWDLPLLFILMILVLSAEWVYRRRKGLP